MIAANVIDSGLAPVRSIIRMSLSSRLEVSNISRYANNRIKAPATKIPPTPRPTDVNSDVAETPAALSETPAMGPISVI